MVVGAPLVEAEQYGTVRVEKLAEVIVGGRRLGLPEERLIPPEAASHVANPDDRPRALHPGSPCSLAPAYACFAMNSRTRG
jgi:hypothetical protein